MGKMLINKPTTCVRDCLEGFVAVNSGIQLLEGHDVVVRADIEDVKRAAKVTLVSGGGSGHEPTHAGFVGSGMLSAAVTGEVFTSPPPNSILAAIRAVGKGNPAGTLLIIKNYTGDRLNFGIASERAKAEGIKVDMVVVGEDCALTSKDKTAGRRGLAGVLFVHKMAGAMAEKGKSLGEIVSFIGKSTTKSSMGTIGLSLSPCSVPGLGPSFRLSENEMELGLGIHGEAGVKRMKVQSAKDSVNTMFSHMSNPQSATHLSLDKGDSVALLVNNLGGTSVLELNIVAKEAILWLESKQINVDRVYCGSFITALQMAGISLTVLKLNQETKKCLDKDTSAPAWLKPYLGKSEKDRETPRKMNVADVVRDRSAKIKCPELDKKGKQMLYKAVSFACEALVNSEKQLNRLDTQSGDGDCGTTLKRGADAIKAALGKEDNPSLSVQSPYMLALSLAEVVEQAMGGSSGGLYSLFLSAAAVPLLHNVCALGFCNALHAGIQAIKKYGGAEAGDRTMLDSLIPAYDVLKKKLDSKVDPLEAFSTAAQTAQDSAEKTASMKAKAGRSSYVSADYLTQPDPGAHAVGIWMKAAYEACKTSSK